MSITLDVHDGFNIGPHDILFQRDGDLNIFDEIEHLLNFNQNLEYTENIPTTTQELQLSADEKNPFNSIESDCISTHYKYIDYLANNNSACLHSKLDGDPMLFIAEGDRLEPLSSKFAISGIYKKIPSTENSLKEKQSSLSSNVFYSKFESPGRIVTQEKFHQLYTLNQQFDEAPPSKVFLMESKEDNTEPLSNDCNPKQKCNDTLNRLAYDMVKLSNQDKIVIDNEHFEIIRTEENSQCKTIYQFLDPKILDLSTQGTEIESSVVDYNMAANQQSSKSVYYKSKSSKPSKRKLEDAKNDEKSLQIKQIQYQSEEGLNAEPIHQQFFFDPTFFSSCQGTEDLQLSSVVTTVDLLPQGNCLQKNDNPNLQINSDYSETIVNTNDITNTKENSRQDVSLYQFLIDKLQNCNNLTEDHKVEVFLDELNDFVHKLQSHSADLIRSTGSEHFINSYISNLLCIPEGLYTLDLSALETPLEEFLSPSQTSTLYSDNNSYILDYTSFTMESSNLLTGATIPKETPLPDGKFRVHRTCYDLTYTDVNKIHLNLNPFEQPKLTTENSYATHVFPPYLSHNGGNTGQAKHTLESLNLTADTSLPLLDLSGDYFHFNNLN